MTARDTFEQRRRMARTASAGLLARHVAFRGRRPLIFRMLGITLPAFQIAGGLILLLTALDMLARQSRRCVRQPRNRKRA